MNHTLTVFCDYNAKAKYPLYVEVNGVQHPVENGGSAAIELAEGFYKIGVCWQLPNGRMSYLSQVYTSITRDEKIDVRTRCAWGPRVSGTLPGQKSKVVAALLNFFLGGLGVHRFYLGYGSGVLFPLETIAAFVCIASGTTLGEIFGNLVLILLGIWEIADFVRILTGSLKPNNGTDYKGNAPAAVLMIQPSAPAAPSASAPAPRQNDSLAALEKLAELHAKGILTDEEFRQKKQDLLAKM